MSRHARHAWSRVCTTHAAVSHGPHSPTTTGEDRMDARDTNGAPLREASAPADAARRSFIQGALATGAALGGIGAASLAHAQSSTTRSTINHYHIAATNETVHWGYFSKSLKPLVEVESGDFVTLETLTHHAGDDL